MTKQQKLQTRSSERLFYQKITDIYAATMDYRVDAETTLTFFASVQNKLDQPIFSGLHEESPQT